MRQWPVQVAVYQDLVAYSPLMNRVTGVYDHVPQGTAYPYVVIGDDTAIEWDTDTSDGVESTLTIHVWSRLKGRRETKEVMELIYDALHRAELQIEGLHSVFCYWEFSETFLDPDGETRHGVTRFRIKAEESLV